MTTLESLRHAIKGQKVTRIELGEEDYGSYQYLVDMRGYMRLPAIDEVLSFNGIPVHRNDELSLGVVKLIRQHTEYRVL